MFSATPSNTVLIDEVSAFKEPVVLSISFALNRSEAESTPTLLNLVLNEPVESPNDFVTLAKTTDDDNIAPAPNCDADATAPSPNKDAEAIAPPENSFANFEPESAAPNEKSFNEPVCSLVNSKLAEWFTEDDSSAPCANAEAVASAPCAKFDADTTAFSPNPFATKSDSCLEDVKESLISDADVNNEPVASSRDILLDTDDDTSDSSEPVVSCIFVTSWNTCPALAVIFPVARISDAVIAPLALKIREPLRLLISWLPILNEPISAFENVASPCAVTTAVGVPTAGNDKEFAANEPSIVTSLVILPPSNKKFEPVICPDDFNTNSPLELDIAPSLTLNPPIDADTNLAAPAAVILAEASAVVEAFAGTNIWLALKLADIFAPPPIVKLPSGCKWKLEELISILSSEPLMNWTPVLPKKNLFVLTSNSPTPSAFCVLNLNEPLFPSCNSIPTPS